MSGKHSLSVEYSLAVLSQKLCIRIFWHLRTYVHHTYILGSHTLRKLRPPTNVMHDHSVVSTGLDSTQRMQKSLGSIAFGAFFQDSQPGFHIYLDKTEFSHPKLSCPFMPSPPVFSLSSIFFPISRFPILKPHFRWHIPQ